MRTTFRRMALPFCLTVSAVLLSGCEDSASRDASAANAVLEEQRAVLNIESIKTPVPGSEDFDSMRTNLKGAASALDGVRSGTDGQQGAAQMMASSAYRQLAEMDLAEATEAADAIQRRVNELYAQLAAAERMSSLAASAEQFADQLTRDHLDRERANWGARLRNAEERLSGLQGPISELQESNSADASRVEELRAEANRLLRRAREMGQIAGQPTLENSVATRRSAERIEYQIAQKEAELSYDLEPQRGWADQQASGFKSIIDTIDSAKTALSQLERELQDQVIGQAQSNAGEFSQALQSGASDLQALIDSSFAPSIESAASNLDNAISRASGASTKSRGRGASTPKVAKAQAEIMKGEVHWTQSRILASYANLMASAAASDAAGSSASSFRSAAQTAQQKATAALEAAKSAFTDAQNSLSTAGGGPEVDKLNQTLSLTLQAVDGMSVDFTEINRTEQGASSSSTSTPSGSGFQTVEELVDYVNNINMSDPSGFGQLIAVMRADSRAGRESLKLVQDMLAAVDEFKAAVNRIDTQGMFVRQFENAVRQNMAGDVAFDSITVASQDEDSAQLTVASQVGGGEIEARKTSQGWLLWISDDSEFMPGSGNSEAEQQMRQYMAMFQTITSQINSGEISNMDELGAAMMQAQMDMGG